MNIKNLFQPSQVRTRYEESATIPEIGPARDPARPTLRIVHNDRAVISGRARALLDEMRQAPDVNTGLRARFDASSLPATRATEVLGRIKHGYYSRPEVQREVASLLGTALDKDLSFYAAR